MKYTISASIEDVDNEPVVEFDGMPVVPRVGDAVMLNGREELLGVVDSIMIAYDKNICRIHLSCSPLQSRAGF